MESAIASVKNGAILPLWVSGNEVHRSWPGGTTPAVGLANAAARVGAECVAMVAPVDWIGGFDFAGLELMICCFLCH